MYFQKVMPGEMKYIDREQTLTQCNSADKIFYEGDRRKI